MTTALEKLTQAELMLAEVASTDDALQIIHLAEAARVYAKQVTASTGAINYATTIKLRAEMRLADIVDEGQEKGEIATRSDPVANQSPESGHCPATLEDIGVTSQRIAEARVLRDAYTEAEIVQLAEEKTEADEILSRDRLIREGRASKPRKEKTPKLDHSLDQEIMDCLSRIEKLIPKWNEDFVDPHKPRACRQRVDLAKTIAAWIEATFVPAHDGKLIPLPTAPMSSGGDYDG